MWLTPVEWRELPEDVQDARVVIALVVYLQVPTHERVRTSLVVAPIYSECKYYFDIPFY